MMKRLFSYNPDLSQSWIVLGLMFFCQLIAGLICSLIILITGSASSSWTTLCGYVLGFIFMGIVIIQLEKFQDPIEIPETQKFKSTFPLYLLLLLFIPLLSISIEPLYSWIPVPEFMENIFTSTFIANFPTFITVVVAAPFAEEWLCRGVILKGLLNNQTPPYKAIAWSSLIFAVLHLNPWQAIPAFCLGFAIGWVYWRTKSLWPCIFMHAVNNGFAFIMLYLFPDTPANASLHDITGPHYFFIYAGAVAFSIVFGYELWQMVGGRVRDDAQV